MLDAIESSFVWTRKKYVLRHATFDASAWKPPALVAGLSCSLCLFIPSSLNPFFSLLHCLVEPTKFRRSALG